MKKLISLKCFTILFAVLSAGIITFSSCSSDNDDGVTPPPTEVAKGEAGKLSWVLTSDGAITFSGKGKMPNYENATTPWEDYRNTIKSLVIKEGVTSVGKEAFKDYTDLTKITLPPALDSIHTLAFAGCGMTDLILFEGTEYIDEKAFASCTSLQNVKFPSTLVCILDSAFAGCTSLKNFTLPDGFEDIWWNAFAGCTSLTEVTYPKGMSSVILGSNNFFIGCSNLKSIKVHPDNEHFLSKDGVIFNFAGEYLLACPGGKTGNYVVPATVTGIYTSAFQACHKLTGITLPDGLTSIYSQAFKDCTGLTEITIPAGIKTIRSESFINCTNLKKVTVLATTPPSLREHNFDAMDDILYVPAASLNAYRADADWSAAFSDIRAL